MLATTLLWLAASAADYRSSELTPGDVTNISTLCHMTTRSKSDLAACLKAQTEKLVAAKKLEVESRRAEEETLRQIGR